MAEDTETPEVPVEAKVEGWWRISYISPDDLNRREKYVGYIIRESSEVDIAYLEDIIRNEFAPNYGGGVYLAYMCDINKKLIKNTGAIKIVIEGDSVEDIDVEEKEETAEKDEGKDDVLTRLQRALEEQLNMKLSAEKIKTLKDVITSLSEKDVSKKEGKDEEKEEERTVSVRRRYSYPPSYDPYERFYTRHRYSSETYSSINELKQSFELLKQQLLTQGKRGDDSQLFTVILQMNQAQMETRKQELELQRERLEQEKLRYEQELKLKEKEMNERLKQEEKKLELEREKIKMELEKYKAEIKAKEQEYDRRLKDERERLKIEQQMREKEILQREREARESRASEREWMATILETLKSIKERKSEYPKEIIDVVTKQASLMQQMSSATIENQLNLAKKIVGVLEEYGISLPSQPTVPAEEEKPKTDLFEGLTKVITALTPFIEASSKQPATKPVPQPIQKAAKILLPKPVKASNRIKSLFGKDPEILKALIVAMRRKEDPALFVGALGNFCGDLTPVVCNLPWSDVKTALSELVDDTGKKVLEDPETEKWWKRLTDETKKAIVAYKKQVEEGKE